MFERSMQPKNGGLRCGTLDQSGHEDALFPKGTGTTRHAPAYKSSRQQYRSNPRRGGNETESILPTVSLGYQKFIVAPAA